MCKIPTTFWFFYGVYTPLDKDQIVTLLTQYVCIIVCVLERA